MLDSNQRSSAPKADAIPGFANRRQLYYINTLKLLIVKAHFEILIIKYHYIIMKTLDDFPIPIVKTNLSIRPTMAPYKNYKNKLTDVLVRLTQNELFYEGKISEVSMMLTKEIVNSLDVDRASVWLYSRSKKSIICEQLYVKSEDKFYQNITLYENDFPEYFEAISKNKIIIADNAETNPATSCFLEAYLKPLQIKSMLDIPIIYQKNVIGVICIESYEPRTWTKEEINFGQLLAPLYSLAYTAMESNEYEKKFMDLQKFFDLNILVDQATLMSKTDERGIITYVNKKFIETSGWSYEELMGSDHRIVNSGTHPPEFWKEMYKTTINNREIWHGIITNKRKDGTLYYVDSYIKAHFNPRDDKLMGFSSVRQEITEIVETIKEIDKKNTYLEHAAKILRHDMHSGINTYIPRGVSSLERRLPKEIIDNYNLGPTIRLIKEGLSHTQKVYKGVKEFTNLVKPNSSLEKQEYSLSKILNDFLSSTAYKDQVSIGELPNAIVNESLFCTAIDNLIRNGLKYNDSDFKIVSIFMIDNCYLGIKDNGRGMSQKDFDEYSVPYARKANQAEKGTGLGLNISIAILKEHGFSVSCQKEDQGTLIKVKIKDSK